MKKVLIGISGGVDSSVAAILLKQQGYEVIGVTFVFTEDFNTSDAIDVCNKIGIKHYIIDYKNIFNKTVINSFINDYESGITPNPCVLCNKEVKFNFLYENMIKYECDYIATGHYAKIKDGKLFKSEDLKKDQTYFLASLTKQQLSKLLLPLEGITKDKVRQIAIENNLVNALKKDSTDVCFIKGSFTDYINSRLQSKKGDIIDIATEKTIGTHDGLYKYTIGQRKGINIGGFQDRLFVVGKDIEKNILYVSSGDNEYLYSDSCLIDNVNWINEFYSNCKAKFRYRQEEIDVKVQMIDNKKAIVSYPNLAKNVTKGQVCVFYNENECLGSGIIKEIYKNNEKLWYL